MWREELVCKITGCQMAHMLMQRGLLGVSVGATFSVIVSSAPRQAALLCLISVRLA